MRTLYQQQRLTWSFFRAGLLEDPTRIIDAVYGLEHSTSLTELQSLHDFSNVYQWFVPNFARVAAPLDTNLRKGHPQTFDE